MNKTILITGATSGIGKATAQLMAQNQYNLIITGRREDRLKLLAGELKKYKINVLPLVFDIREKEEVDLAIDSLPEDWKNIDILINNAGLAAGLDPIDKGNLQDWEQMIDTNVKGLLYITRKISPWMVERKEGQIINIGSIAGKEVYGNGSVYCASKFAVDALTRGMRIDLAKYGIRIAGVHPGMVETEFSLVRFKGNEKTAKNVYKGMKPLTGNDIAEIILFMITRPPHVTVADVLILPTSQASATVTYREE